jgi:hypothetical protein
MTEEQWEKVNREIWDWAIQQVRLQKPNGSVLHSLIDAWKGGRLLVKPGHESTYDPSDVLNFEFQTFVIEHDWVAVINNHATGLKAELEEDALESKINFQTPYDHCCFEFAVSGKRVCFLSHRHDDSHNYFLSLFVQMSMGWAQFPLKVNSEIIQEHGMAMFLRKQFYAIGIMLDAAAIKTDVIRAPEKLNRARVRRCQLPLYDYHVVNLAKRTSPRMLPESVGVSERNKVRLHFRRGHWRHFDSFKTWINWMLVGDPDLGFVDKHYRA